MLRSNLYKLLWIIFTIFSVGHSPYAQNINTEENFPDPNFRAFVEEYMGVESGGEFTAEEAAAKTEIMNCGFRSIETLKGIEYFINITDLLCYNNKLSSLDVSANKALERLTCGVNQLSSLDVSTNTALERLDCDNNQLSSFDVSTNTALERLDCDNNQLSSLDVSTNTALIELNCHQNKLSILDVSSNTALKSLNCSYNQLNSLDLSTNIALSIIYCDYNQLSSLDVSANTVLAGLSCSNNQISSLDVSKNTALIGLNCDNNHLSNLDVSSNTALKSFNCSYNQLSSSSLQSIINNEGIGKGDTIHIYKNNLNCSDWNGIQTLIDRGVKLSYSPQNGLRSFECEGVENTPIPPTSTPTITPTPIPDDVSPELNWEMLEAASSPPARMGHGMAFDDVRERLVVFGGSTTGRSHNSNSDTWEWDGNEWSEIQPATVPTIRRFTAMAYDKNRRKVVMFGGHSGRTFLNDTWEWDGNDWEEKSPAGEIPPGRSLHRMFYHYGLGKVVLSGGYAGGNLPMDIWAWDGNNWENLNLSGTPSDRRDHSIEVDYIKQTSIMLFGGFFASPSTWILSGNKWTERTLNTSPSARGGCYTVFDPIRNKTVLYGGMDVNTGTLRGDFEDTWEWDRKQWQQISTTNTPGTLANYGMTYDSKNQKILLFGGINQSSQVTNELWEYGTGIEWKEYGESRYAVIPPQSWSDAEEQAQRLGGHLVAINSQEENQWITDNLLDQTTALGSAWIGYFYDETDGVWKWSNRETTSYDNWGVGEPNYLSSAHYITEIRSNTDFGLGVGIWNNVGTSYSWGEAVILPAIIEISNNTILPTPTNTNIPSTNTPVMSINTPTPVLPTNTPIPSVNPNPNLAQVFVYDDPTLVSGELTGQTDFDTLEERNLTITWNADNTDATDWHIFVQKGFSGMKFLGRTADGNVSQYDWSDNTTNVAEEFASGPDFNSVYTFRVVRIDGSLGSDDFYDQQGVTGFNIEGGNELSLSRPALPNLNIGQASIFDDLLGGNDLAPTGLVGEDIDVDESRALQIAWNFGVDVSTVNEYHIQVSIDGGDFEFLGQTLTGTLNYFWWTPNNEFKTSATFNKGPQDGHSYQFRIFLIPFEGMVQSLNTGTIQFSVLSEISETQVTPTPTISLPPGLETEVIIPLGNLPDGSIPLEMKLIPAGTFLMGSPIDERGRSEFDWPQHEVTITQPFYIGTYEVTQAQWEAVMGSNPSFFCWKSESSS